jgi:hypothetical protein
MGFVAMYIKERKASKVEVKASNDYSMTFELKHTIADNVSKYDYPLSLRVKSDWNKVEVTQDGAQLQNKIDGGYIYFDAVPNAGDIVVRNTGVKYVTVTPGTDVTVSGTVAWTSDGTDYYAEGATITLGYDGTVPTGYTVGYTVTKAGGGTVSVDVTDGISSFVMPADDVTVAPNKKKLMTNADIKVSAIADQTCTGAALTPAVTVKDGTTDITAQCDIAYKNNTDVGTATVTITAKAASTLYSGETTTTFDIFHKSDANRDKKINAADIVKLVNDNAPQSDIDEVVKIIMQNK